MIAGLVLALVLQGGGVARAPTVTARVSPEAPAVGEPITVELRVRAARGTLVRFPVLPDTGTRIEPLDPRSISGGETADGVEQVATYRLIAWDTGGVAPAFGDITVERDGRVTRYAVPLSGLRIRSVLPSDTASRTPRPARDPAEAPTMPWRWLVAAAVVALLAAWGRQRHRRAREMQATVDPGAARRAREALAQLRRLDLCSAGEPGRHLLAHLQVLRRYLAERWPALSPALTARELERRLEEVEFPVLPDRVVSLVAAGEPVAYAGAAVGSAEAERYALEVSTVVEDVERAWLARQAREQAEAARIRRKKLR